MQNSQLSLVKNLKKKLFRIIILFFIIVSAIVIFIVMYISRRGGADYTGPLANLLPAETIAYGSIKNLHGLWETAASKKNILSLTESPELDSLLSSYKKIGKWEKKLGRFENKSHLKLGKEFLLKWFGDDVAVALVPTREKSTPPTFLVMSKTRIGFEEKLAEFIAQLYPDLRLDSLSYRRTKIQRYIGKEDTGSFSYLRFGRTVFLSLYTSDTTALKYVIDLKLEPTLPRLYTRTNFQQYKSEIGTKDGISLFILPGETLKYLANAENLPTVLTNSLSLYEYMHLNVTLDKDLLISIFLKYKTSIPAPLPPADFMSMNYISRRAILFLGFKDRQLYEMLSWIFNAILSSKDADYFSQLFQKVINQEFSLSVERLEPGLILPMAEANLFMNVKNSNRADQQLKKILPLFSNPGRKNPTRNIPTPIGLLDLVKNKEIFTLRLHLEEKHDELKMINENLTQADYYRRVFPSGISRSRIILYANFLRLKEDAARAVRESPKWGKKYKKTLKLIKNWTDVLGYLQGCGLWDKHEREGIRYHLIIPLD